MHDRDKGNSNPKAVSEFRRPEKSEPGPGIPAPVIGSCLANYSTTVRNHSFRASDGLFLR